MAAAIEVLSIKPLDSGGTVKAFVDIRVGAVEIHGCKIVQQDGQRPWVAMPSTKSGERWFNVVEITSKDLKQRITDVVLEAWQEPRQEIIPPGGRTVVHRNPKRDPRQEYAEAIAARFEPDEEPPF
jgi:DNA-binding cell septation regulator SpoVG